MTGFEGFDRPVGRAGARNHVLVLPSVVCSALVARQIAEAAGATSVAHQHGCGHIGADITQTKALFVGLAASPNVGQSMVISLGCETVQGNAVAAELVRLGYDTRFVSIQKAGGNDLAREAGIREAQGLVQRAHLADRKRVGLDTLTLGLAIARDDDRVADLISRTTEAGGRVVLALGADASLPVAHEVASEINIGDEPVGDVSVIRNPGLGGSHLLAALASCRTQVLVEFAPDDQPPLGFPLAPVVSVAAATGLHTLIGQDFDLDANDDVAAIVESVRSAFSGSATLAEGRSSGVFSIPRLMRTM